MKTSKILKTIIAFCIALLTLLILNTNSVNATDLTKEDLQNILDLIPSEIYIDVPETAANLESTNTAINTKIKNILTEKNVNLAGITISFFGYTDAYNLSATDYFHKGTIEIFYNSSSGTLSVNKEIRIKYSNSDKYNSADEQEINNLEFSYPDYLIMDYSTASAATDFSDYLEKFLAEYYGQNINDNSIKLMLGEFGGSCYLDGFHFHGAILQIFKNDVFYNVITKIPNRILFQFTIPADVEDNEQAYKDYIYSQIKDELASAYNITSSDKLTLTKGGKIYEYAYDKEKQQEYIAKTIEVNDGWTLNINNQDEAVYVIKKEVKAVSETDKNTGITLDTASDVVPANTKLVVESITSGSSYNTVKSALSEYKKIEVFDLSLLSNNQEIQPSGKVKIRIPVPAGMDESKIEVYRVDGNGTKTKYDCKVETINNKKYITFETDHFSLYVLAEKAEVSNTSNNSTTTNTNSSTTSTETNADNNKGKLDETPKTGNISVQYSVIFITIILSISSIFVVRRYTSERK